MRQANPKLIGVFVIGGLALFVAALVFFSSNDLFTPKRCFVAYFQQSVNGLNVGAPARFRGIPVGEVVAVDGVYDPETGDMIPRVEVEFRPEAMENAEVQGDEYTLYPLLLERGLRASLKSSSMLTGNLYVALDFRPDVPERYLGGQADEWPEWPTFDSGLDQTLQKLSDLPFEELLARASGALVAAEELFRDPHIKEALTALPSTLAAVEDLLRDPRLNDALAALPTFLQDADAAVGDLRETLASARSSLESLTTTLTDESLGKVNSTLTEMEKTLQLAQKRLGTDDVLTRELVTTLRGLDDAARSIQALADSLEEHPESLLRGKKR